MPQTHGTDAPVVAPKNASAVATDSAPVVAPVLVEKLACPACEERPPVTEIPGPFLQCTRCGRRYPVDDGIPVMLIEEAVLTELQVSSLCRLS